MNVTELKSMVEARALWGVAGLGILAASLTLAGCATTDAQQSSSANKSTVVYVADFGLVPEEIHDDPGILTRLPIISRRAEKFLYGQEPATQRARELVDLMSKSLIKDIEERGYTAVRFSPNLTMPTNGWLVRGTYTHVQEGNRLKRSMIGLGKGETDVQVMTVFNELSEEVPGPLYRVETESNSSHLPGGGATLAFGPYGATTKFVLAGSDLEKNVVRTATKITEALAQQIEASD